MLALTEALQSDCQVLRGNGLTSRSMKAGFVAGVVLRGNDLTCTRCIALCSGVVRSRSIVAPAIWTEGTP